MAALIVCGVYDWSLLCYAFHFHNHLAEEERAGYFILIVFLLLRGFGALSLFLMVSWVRLQCVIVAFPGNTHLPF